MPLRIQSSAALGFESDANTLIESKRRTRALARSFGDWCEMHAHGHCLRRLMQAMIIQR